jgi:hypothetical protein
MLMPHCNKITAYKKKLYSGHTLFSTLILSGFLVLLMDGSVGGSVDVWVGRSVGESVGGSVGG